MSSIKRLAIIQINEYNDEDLNEKLNSGFGPNARVNSI